MKDINLFKFLWQFVNKKKFLFILLVIIVVIIDVIEVFGTQVFNKKIFGSLEIENFNFYLTSFFIFIYAICQHMHHFVDRIRDKIRFESVQKTQMKIRNYLFDYTIQHSIEYFNNSFSGDLNNKITNFVNDFEKFVDVINNIAMMLIMLILTPVFYAKINIYLSLLFIMLALLYIFSLKSIKEKLKKCSKILAEVKNRYISQINDDLTNIINIKTFANEEFERLNILKITQEIDSANYEYLKIFSRLKMVNFIVMFLLFFFIISFGGVMLVMKQIDFGTFIFITIIVSIMRFVLDEITDKFIVYSELVGRMENSLNKILQPIDIVNKSSKMISVINGKIVFKNITFNYKK